MGVTDLSPSIAIYRPLLPAIEGDRSASFAIDQKTFLSIEKNFHYRSSSIGIFTVNMIKSVNAD